MINTLKKGVGLLNVGANVVIDTVTGAIDVGSNIKRSITNEIDSLQEERDMDNATSRILNRAERIKEISEALGISLEEARELLKNELNK